MLSFGGRRQLCQTALFSYPNIGRDGEGTEPEKGANLGLFLMMRGLDMAILFGPNLGQG